MSAIVVALVGASAVGQFFLKFYLGRDSVFGIVPFLNVGMEDNLPTWYSSSALLFCAATLGVIAQRARALRVPHHTAWAALCGIFVLLSIDEAVSLHEGMTRPVRDHVADYFSAWVIPGAILVLIVGLAFLRFVRDLPRRTRRLVVLAGTLFVSGALGLEAVAGIIRTSHAYNPDTQLPLAILTTLEELLEMVGIVVFAYALLDYLGGLTRAREADVPAPVR